MTTVEASHAHLFPYAVALAKAEGAEEVLIEPRLPNIIPDVLGIRDSDLVEWFSPVYCQVTKPGPDGRKPLIIVQIETSTGAKLGGGGGKRTLEKHAPAADFADFLYILDNARNMPAIRRSIVETIPGATVFSEDEVEQRFGRIRLSVESGV